MTFICLVYLSEFSYSKSRSWNQKWNFLVLRLVSSTRENQMEIHERLVGNAW